MLLSQLERGETPATVDLKVYLSYAASVLEHVSKTDPYTRYPTVTYFVNVMCCIFVYALLTARFCYICC
jgi:hypothetical protein